MATSSIAAPRLSSADFTNSVLALKPRVAVFDCDDTLWAGDSGSAFMRWSMETGLFSREMSDWLDARYRGYQRGEVGEIAICGEMVQVYRGLREEELRKAAKTFFLQHEKNIFSEMRALVAALQKLGTEIWAVSSTNDWVVEEGVTRFGIPASRVLAACVHVRDGVISGDLRDVPSDEGKVAALARVGITAPEAVFGNSIHDAAMLAIAKRAFPVNPTPALEEIAARSGWPVYYPEAVAR